MARRAGDALRRTRVSARLPPSWWLAHGLHLGAHDYDLSRRRALGRCFMQRKHAKRCGTRVDGSGASARSCKTLAAMAHRQLLASAAGRGDLHHPRMTLAHPVAVSRKQPARKKKRSQTRCAPRAAAIDAQFSPRSAGLAKHHSGQASKPRAGNIPFLSDRPVSSRHRRDATSNTTRARPAAGARPGDFGGGPDGGGSCPTK